MKTIKRIALLFLLLVWGGMSICAQSRLTPISAAYYWDKDVLTDYAVEVKRLLLPFSKYNFAYIVTPSFRSEYSLVGIDDSTLVVRKAEQRINLSLNNRSIETIHFDIENGEIRAVETPPVKDSVDKPINISVKEYQLHVSPTIMESIDKLFTSAVVSSSYLCGNQGCDGTDYIFIIDGDQYTATCWSPGEGSNCRKLVNLADSIVKAVELHDRMLIKNKLDDIAKLHQTFEELYKKKKPLIDYLITFDNPNGRNVKFFGKHFVAFLCFTFLIFIVIGVVGLIILRCYQKLRKYWWVPLLSAILIFLIIIVIACLYLKLNAISW